MPLGIEVGLDPSDTVLHGDPSPLPKIGAELPPNFRPMSIVANGWMDQDATWYGDRPRPMPHCVRWGPSSPPRKKVARDNSLVLILFKLAMLKTAKFLGIYLDQNLTWNKHTESISTKLPRQCYF